MIHVCCTFKIIHLIIIIGIKGYTKKGGVSSSGYVCFSIFHCLFILLISWSSTWKSEWFTCSSLALLIQAINGLSLCCINSSCFPKVKSQIVSQLGDENARQVWQFKQNPDYVAMENSVAHASHNFQAWLKSNLIAKWEDLDDWRYGGLIETGFSFCPELPIFGVISHGYVIFLCRSPGKNN